MARMSIDDKFLRDARVVLLGRRFAWSRRETMGALLDLFAVAYDREDDVIPAAEIDVTAGEAGFADALIDVDLGEPTADGVRIKGAAARIEYLTNKREAGRKGGRKSGEARRNRNEAKRSTPSSDREAHGNPPDPVPDLVPDPVPDLIPDLPPAHAIPPSPVPSTTLAQSFADRDLAKLRAIGDLALATWKRLSDLRMDHAGKLRLEGVLPFPAIHPGYHPRAFEALRDRIREEGDNARATCDHVLRVLDDQATTDKSIEWLSDKAFLERPWAKARETVLSKRKPPAKAPSAAPAPIPTENLAGAAELAAAWAVLGIAKEIP
jgi:hypothetical protein